MFRFQKRIQTLIPCAIRYCMFLRQENILLLLFIPFREVLDLDKEIKDIIIVAIADNGETDADWIAERYNDFTHQVFRNLTHNGLK